MEAKTPGSEIWHSLVCFISTQYAIGQNNTRNLVAYFFRGLPIGDVGRRKDDLIL